MGISNFFRESFIICRRQLRMNLRNPAWIIIGLLQPVMYLVLFGPLLKPLTAQFGATNAYTFFVPGLLVQLTVFGAMFVGFGVIAEWRDGVIEAERVTPASRTALLCGRLMRDVTQLGVQSIILIALGYAMGMKAPIAGVILGMIITLFAGAASAAASNALALTSKDEDVMGPLTNMLIMPILLLSGIILPMSLAPAWLERLSDFMPTRYIVDAVRAIFAENPDAATVTWGILWSLVIFFAGIWWGTRTYQTMVSKYSFEFDGIQDNGDSGGIVWITDPADSSHATAYAVGIASYGRDEDATSPGAKIIQPVLDSFGLSLVGS